MKRIFAASTILIYCLFLQACSYSVDFVLVNESDTTVEIEYLIEGVGSGSGTEQLKISDRFIPKTMSFGKWDSSHERDDWTPLGSNEFKVDLDRGTIKIRIPPRTALRLAEVSDSVFFGDGYRNFELKELEVRGLYGNIKFEGVQLFRQFNEKSRYSYFISYKK